MCLRKLLSAWLGICIFVAALSAHAAAGAQPAATPVGGSFLLSGAPSDWQVGAGSGTVEVVVHDIDGVVVYGKQLVLSASAGATFVLPALPGGFYRLSVRGAQGPASSTSFVVQTSKAIAPDKRFGIDAALSWHGGDDKAVAKAITMIQAAGLGSVRDRLRWSQVNPAKGIYEWGRYLDIAKRVGQAGLSSVTVFHDAPAWTRPADPVRSGDRRPPSDMQAVKAFGVALARDMGPYLEAVEFWNEQNSDFFMGTPWQYSAALKAFYLGVKSGRPQLKVLIGSASGDPGQFFRGIYANSVQRSFDVRNQHFYADPDKFLDFVATQVGPLESSGIVGNRPGWLTETGLGVKQIKGAVTISSERDQAIHLVKAYMTGLAAGYERVFYFFLRELTEEGRNNWGILNSDFSPRLAYAALGSLVRHIGGRPLAGYRRDAGSMTLYFGDATSGIVGVAWGRAVMTTRWDADVRFADIVGRTIDQRRAMDGAPVLFTNVNALPPGLALTQQQRDWAADPLNGALAVDLEGSTSNDAVSSHMLEVPTAVGSVVKLRGTLLPGQTESSGGIAVECKASDGLKALVPSQTVMQQQSRPTTFECDYFVSLRQGQRGSVGAVVALTNGPDAGVVRLVAVPDYRKRTSDLAALCLPWRARSALIVESRVELTKGPAADCPDGFVVTAEMKAPGDGWVFPIAEVPSDGRALDGVEFFSAIAPGASYPAKPLMMQLVDRSGAIWILPLATRRMPDDRLHHSGLFASASLAPWSSVKSSNGFGTAALVQMSIGYAGGGTKPGDKASFSITNLRALRR